MLASGKFAIPILGAKQEAVARQFAQWGGTRFDAGDFDRTEGGLAVVSSALSQADCRVATSTTSAAPPPHQ